MPPSARRSAQGGGALLPRGAPGLDPVAVALGGRLSSGLLGDRGHPGDQLLRCQWKLHCGRTPDLRRRFAVSRRTSRGRGAWRARCSRAADPDPPGRRGRCTAVPKGNKAAQRIDLAVTHHFPPRDRFPAEPREGRHVQSGMGPNRCCPRRPDETPGTARIRSKRYLLLLPGAKHTGLILYLCV